MVKHKRLDGCPCLACQRAGRTGRLLFYRVTRERRNLLVMYTYNCTQCRVHYHVIMYREEYEQRIIRRLNHKTANFRNLDKLAGSLFGRAA